MNNTASEIVDSMDAISLAEMDISNSLMNRVDTKYVLNGGSLSCLIERIAPCYRVLTVMGKRLSPYSTLYFDGPNHECFLQHHNGKLNRYKIRQREYLSTKSCFLEVKQKSNKGRTEKRRIPIQANVGTFSEESLEFLQSIFGNRPNVIPQLWTFFSRITLVHRHCPERVTFDCDLNFRFDENDRQLPGTVIAEIKQTYDNRHSPIREQLRYLGIRPLRVSKYCLGSMLLKPHLKYNRFKSKLRTIERIMAFRSPEANKPKGSRRNGRDGRGKSSVRNSTVSAFLHDA